MSQPPAHPSPGGFWGYLALGVAVAVFVLIPHRQLLGVVLLDLLVGHLLADPLWDSSVGDIGGGLWGSPPSPKKGAWLTASISLRAFHCS